MKNNKFIVVLSALLCTSVLAFPITGCDKNKSSGKKDKDKKISSDDEEDDEDEEEEVEINLTEDDEDTQDTTPKRDYDADTFSLFANMAETLLDVPDNGFGPLFGVDGVVASLSHNMEYELTYIEFETEEEAEAMLDKYKNIAELNSDSRTLIEDDAVYLDDYLTMSDGSFHYVYATAAVDGYYFYYFACNDEDLEKMWTLNSMIGVLGFYTPYNMLGGNPDIERTTENGSNMEDLIDIGASVFGCDISEFEEEPTTVDVIESYAYVSEEFCVEYDLLNFKANALTYLWSYYSDVSGRYPDSFSNGDCYFFGQIDDPEFVCGGMFVSDCYLITVECYTEEGKEQVKDFIDKTGLPMPDGL